MPPLKWWLRTPEPQRSSLRLFSFRRLGTPPEDFSIVRTPVIYLLQIRVYPYEFSLSKRHAF